MRKFVLALSLVLVTNANAQFVDSVLLQFAPSIAFRLFLDSQDSDKLENTPPVTITASGMGDTCDAALTNAKQNALGKVNGSWVHSRQRSKDGSYEEEIVQHSGGVVSSYKYLRNDCTFVIIEAQVRKRSNRVQLESANINRPDIIHLEGIKQERDSRNLAIEKLNNRREAVYFSPKRTRLEFIPGNFVAVGIKGDLAYKDKWKADYLELREMIGYFNLPAFEPYARVVITAYDSIGDKLYTTDFLYEGNWELWTRRSYGASPTMNIHPNRTEEMTVRFKIPYDIMKHVSKFIIDVI